MTVLVLSFDVGNHVPTELTQLIESNRFLLDEIKEARVQYEPAYTMLGSPQQGSADAILSIEAIESYLEIPFDKFLLHDVQRDLADGHSHHEIQHGFQYEIDLSLSRLIIIYTQLHKIACAHRNEDIEFRFYSLAGNNEELAQLAGFFNAYPEMLPKNLRLNLNNPGLSEASSSSQQLALIQGCGFIDWSYRDTALAMIQFARQSTNSPISEITNALTQGLLTRKQPEITLQLKGSIKEIKQSDETFSANMAVVAEGLTNLGNIALRKNDREFLNEAILHYRAISQPTELWQLCVPSNIDTCSQYELNQFFINVDKLTATDELNVVWTNRLKSYFWITSNHARLEDIIVKNSKINMQFLRHLQASNTQLAIGALLIMPFQRLTKLPLFSGSWSKSLRDGFLSNDHPALRAVEGFDSKMTGLLGSFNQIIEAKEHEEGLKRNNKRRTATLVNSTDLANKLIDQLVEPTTLQHSSSEGSEIASSSSVDVLSNSEQLLSDTSVSSPLPGLTILIESANESENELDEEELLLPRMQLVQANVKSQLELTEEHLIQLKDNLLEGIRANRFPVWGGFFAGSKLQCSDGSIKKVPAHISEFMKQITQVESGQVDSISACQRIIELAALAEKASHIRRSVSTHTLYETMFSNMGIDSIASLAAIREIAIRGKEYWQTMIHQRPTTVNRILALIDDPTHSPDERLKQVLVIAHKASLLNGEPLNLRSQITENFYAELRSFLVFKDVGAINYADNRTLDMGA